MPAASAGSFTDRDNGYAGLLKRLAKEHLTGAVDVGVQGSEAGEAKLVRINKEGDTAVTGETVAAIATIHEFGLGGVDQRSFIRDYVDENRDHIEAMIRKVAEGVIAGRVSSFEVGLGLLGRQIAGEIQERIRKGIDPPLADTTKDRKGSSTPLIDTTQLITSITYIVKKLAGVAG